MTCGRGTYTSLASTEQAVVQAYRGYTDSVIKGETRTNDLPMVAQSFNAFQASFRAAVSSASGDTNAPVSSDVATAASSIIQAIHTAQGKK